MSVRRPPADGRLTPAVQVRPGAASGTGCARLSLVLGEVRGVALACKTPKGKGPYCARTTDSRGGQPAWPRGSRSSSRRANGGTAIPNDERPQPSLRRLTFDMSGAQRQDAHGPE